MGLDFEPSFFAPREQFLAPDLQLFREKMKELRLRWWQWFRRRDRFDDHCGDNRTSVARRLSASSAAASAASAAAPALSGFLRRVLGALRIGGWRSDPSFLLLRLGTLALLLSQERRPLGLDGFGDRRFILIGSSVGQIREAAGENHRGGVGWARLTTTSATPPSAALSDLDLDIIAVVKFGAFWERHWNRVEHGPLRTGEATEIDVSATLVVRVDVHAIDRDRFANADVNASPSASFQLVDSTAFRREEHGCDARRANDFDALNLAEAEQEFDLAQMIGRDCFRHHHLAEPVAVRTVDEVRFSHARTHPLPRHLDDAKVADRKQC